MRELFIANWKMFKSVDETVSFINELKNLVPKNIGRDISIAPPFTSIHAASLSLKGSNINLGAQNCHFEEKGAFTGEISPLQLKDLGVRYVIVGHSERRAYFHESDELIAKKVRKLLDLGLIPVVCIGETKQERDLGKTFSILETQLKGSLRDTQVSESRIVVIAYEPVWAIGTGETATPQIAGQAHKFIREKLGEIVKRTLASEIVILYGGSVKPDNISELMAKDDINGALIGGASLDAKSFSKIVNYSNG